jgi:hypothetical protein
VRNEYLTAENRILRAQIKGCFLILKRSHWRKLPTGWVGKL